jgi:pyruvate dehydrogenase E2 component (dihydrolipoamide acetyltransferase)
MSIEVIMPHLGAVMEESTLLKWLIGEGDLVKKGQPIFEAESDKATVEVESPETGRIVKLIASPGEVIQVGEVVGLLQMLDETDDTSHPETEKDEIVVKESPEVHTVGESKGEEESDRVVASPLARRLARTKGIDLQKLVGTGPGGRIIKADVEEATMGQPAIPAFYDTLPPEVIVPISTTRSTIAKRMAHSTHTAAAVTLNTEVEASALVNLRQALRAQRPDLAPFISFDLILMKIAAQALREFPEVNASLTKEGIAQHSNINIGVAVDADRGLLVPVVKDIDQRDLFELAQDLEDKITRAKTGKITAEELRGGTFTITNLGVFGIDTFTPIINLPECAILGIGRIKDCPVVRMGVVVPGKIINLSLTFDHRVIDGGPAARFLQEVARILEHPGGSGI